VLDAHNLIKEFLHLGSFSIYPALLFINCSLDVQYLVVFKFYFAFSPESVVAKNFLILFTEHPGCDHNVKSIVNSPFDVLLVFRGALTTIRVLKALNKFLSNLLVCCLPKVTNNVFHFQTEWSKSYKFKHSELTTLLTSSFEWFIMIFYKLRGKLSRRLVELEFSRFLENLIWNKPESIRIMIVLFMAQSCLHLLWRLETSIMLESHLFHFETLVGGLPAFNHYDMTVRRT